MTSSHEALVGKVQHTAPCHDCPMRRNAIPGWLGGATPEEYRNLCHSDARVDCHAIRGTQCAGVAIYRTNVVKRAAFRLPANHAAVFSTPMEFVEWHSDMAGSFAKLSAAHKAKAFGRARPATSLPTPHPAPVAAPAPAARAAGPFNGPLTLSAGLGEAA